MNASARWPIDRRSQNCASLKPRRRHATVITGDRFCDMEAGRDDLPPVLLLHGIDASSLHWRYQLAGLADRFRLIAWNPPAIC